ncbi:MAG: hypothetical protein ACOZIN_18955 [Myxococcota bacterium]
MNDALRAKASDLRDSALLAIRDLNRLASEVRAARQRVHATSTQLELYGAGALVHGYYTHLERLFERVARDLNSVPLDGPDWHRRLLHLFRNLYVLDLDGVRILAVLERVDSVHEHMREAIEKFIEFLDQLMRGS